MNWKEMFSPKGREGSPDLILLSAVLILVAVGTIMIYSSSSIMAMERFRDGLYFLKRQVVYVAFGLLLMIRLSRFPYENLRSFAYPGVIVSVILLILVFVPHIGIRVGGARRWINLGFISFQVSELVKMALVLFLAYYVDRKTAHLKDFRRGIVIPFSVVLVLAALVVKEPDFGTAAILVAITMMMLYVGGVRLTHLMGIAALAVPVGVFFVLTKGYRISRITAFLDPWRDPQRSGFQIIQSYLSFGSGGTFGVGVGDGMQKLFYLPEPHTDFILSVLAEEGGFFGVAVVICLFIVLILRGFFISMRAPDTFGSLLAAGLTMVIALEAFINIAGVMGIIPLKGLALPFLSYGGTALVTSLAAVGILLNISSHET
ncbi:MAG TPA: putative lipid II flippase FtsW [Syntrophales bacterium]|nr:putative lipid II flippase FtsW [Syntrophales bacterium]HOM06082.1 putative lipid II flippase FtsW [Syntrophales bacterium]HRS86037.1 putative lipid II flippase FtsW [Syntrophales bacterium]